MKTDLDLRIPKVPKLCWEPRHGGVSVHMGFMASGGDV